MKNKKVTMLVAALVVAVVAAAGIGYATTYTAKTYNSDNTLDSTYLTIEQGGSGSYFNFLTGVYFDTETTKASTTVEVQTKYMPVCEYNDSFTKVTTGGTYALISEMVTLTIKHKDNGQASGTLVVEATEGFTKYTNFTYDMVIKDTNNTATKGTFSPASGDEKAKWTFTIDLPSGTTASKTYTVGLFVKGYTTSPTEAAAMGFAATGATTNLSKFTFIVTADTAATNTTNGD